MIVALLAALMGIIAGLRNMVAAAAISWAAHLGFLDLSQTWLAFLGHAWTPWIFTLLALGEFVGDQLPSTPSRTVPLQFGTRIVIGLVAGVAIGLDSGVPVLGGIAWVLGAVVGTLGGSAVRTRMAELFGSDRPAGFLEDAIAVVLALLVTATLP